MINPFCFSWPVYCKCLEELGTVSDGLRVLYNNAHPAAGRAVRNLDPVTAQARLGRQVDGDGGHTVARWVSTKQTMSKLGTHETAELIKLQIVFKILINYKLIELKFLEKETLWMPEIKRNKANFLDL